MTIRLAGDWKIECVAEQRQRAAACSSEHRHKVCGSASFREKVDKVANGRLGGWAQAYGAVAAAAAAAATSAVCCALPICPPARPIFMISQGDECLSDHCAVRRSDCHAERHSGIGGTLTHIPKVSAGPDKDDPTDRECRKRASNLMRATPAA